MQKKLYLGGLPWELDRIGLLNYFKAILEGNNIAASYELPFISTPLINSNATIRVVDVFVALDRQTNKSRGFGFITLDILSDDAETVFANIIEMLNIRVLIGIRGPRELIVKEADPRNPDAPSRRDDNMGFDDAPRSMEAAPTTDSVEGEQPVAEGEQPAAKPTDDATISW